MKPRTGIADEHTFEPVTATVVAPPDRSCGEPAAGYGTELATRIGVEFPDIPVILMSAFAPGGVARLGHGDTIVPVLQKPFDTAELAQLVDLALRHPLPPPAGVRIPSR